MFLKKKTNSIYTYVKVTILLQSDQKESKSEQALQISVQSMGVDMSQMPPHEF
jgi:hypothetical protein